MRMHKVGSLVEEVETFMIFGQMMGLGGYFHEHIESGAQDLHADKRDVGSILYLLSIECEFSIVGPLIVCGVGLRIDSRFVDSQHQQTIPFSGNLSLAKLLNIL